MSNYPIDLEKINVDVPPPGSRREKEQRTLSWTVPWVVGAITLGIVLLVMYFYYRHPIRPEGLLTVDFYLSVWDAIIPVKSKIDVAIFLVFFISLYYFATSTLYNVLDCIALPIWLATRKKKKNLRSNVRYWVIRFFYLLPINIPKWLFIWWVGMLFGIFGAGNPLTKEGRDENNKRYTHTSSRASEEPSERAVANTESRPDNAWDLFMADYIAAASYARTHGGPIQVSSTYGLTEEEMQRVIANAERYLDDIS